MITQRQIEILRGLNLQYLTTKDVRLRSATRAGVDAFFAVYERELERLGELDDDKVMWMGKPFVFDPELTAEQVEFVW